MPKQTPAPAAQEESSKETVEKVEASPVASKVSTRNRNRFNARPSTTTLAPEQNGEVQSTPSRLLRPRPNFNARPRGRPGAASTTETAPAAEENEEKPEADEESKEEAPVEAKSAVLTRPTSRLNLNRPTNRLLPGQQKRVSPLSRGKTSEDDSNKDKSGSDGDSETETTTQNNLIKLKNRPRIQINTEPKKKTSANNVVVNRKVNPLLSKRKFGLVSTTGELYEDSEVVNCVNIPIYADAPADVEEKNDEDSDNNPKEGAKEEASDEHKEEESTEPVEVSSEQPRGLSKFLNSQKPALVTNHLLIFFLSDLLNRRNILKRRPGTIL